MAAINSPLSPAVPNRRRRVRHKIQTPAYASFTAESKSAMLDLHEIVDISEDGMSIQCHSRLDLETKINLCLDLAHCPQHIYTTGQVIWSNASGRTGLRFADLPSESLARLREWLFVNVMSGVANGEAEIAAVTPAREIAPLRPGYSDTLAAVGAIRRQVETLGTDFPRALQLIAERAQSLMHASGAAIALADNDADSMVCCARSGADAPPIGARLQSGSGFSGECVKRSQVLRCDDADNDTRVDRESCRALGIRSILAAPVRMAEKSVGLVEAFSPSPQAFSDDDGVVLQRLADIVLEAAHRAARIENLPFLKPGVREPSPSVPNGILFSSADQGAKPEGKPEEASTSSISLPHSHLILLVCAAAAIMFGLGWAMAPWIQSDAAPWIVAKIHSHDSDHLPTVFASSQAPKSDTPTLPSPAMHSVAFEQLMLLAEKGDAAAQNALALRYAVGEGVKLSEVEAVRWFSKAADQGYVTAQSKLGSLYFSGRGVAQDLNRAYFWMVVARMGGDEASNTLAPSVRARLTNSQAASIESDAQRWLQQHRPNAKPGAGQLKIEAVVNRHHRPTR